MMELQFDALNAVPRLVEDVNVRPHPDLRVTTWACGGSLVAYTLPDGTDGVVHSGYLHRTLYDLGPSASLGVFEWLNRLSLAVVFIVALGRVPPWRLLIQLAQDAADDQDLSSTMTPMVRRWMKQQHRRLRGALVALRGRDRARRFLNTKLRQQILHPEVSAP
jgi:hypothetical protein